VYCTYIKNTITINSLYEVYTSLFKKIVSFRLHRLHDIGDTEMKDENATVRIMNRHMLSNTVGVRKGLTLPFEGCL